MKKTIFIVGMIILMSLAVYGLPRDYMINQTVYDSINISSLPIVEWIGETRQVWSAEGWPTYERPIRIRFASITEYREPATIIYTNYTVTEPDGTIRTLRNRTLIPGRIRNDTTWYWYRPISSYQSYKIDHTFIVCMQAGRSANYCYNSIIVPKWNEEIEDTTYIVRWYLSRWQT